MHSDIQNTQLEPPGPFTLGAAQLGLPYGLGAARTPLDDRTVADILDCASQGGIRWLDTAAAYGLSEMRIGRWRREGRPPFRIVSKLPPLSDDISKDLGVEAAIGQSLARLNRSSIDIYLTHRAADVMRPKVVSSLRKAVDDGKIGRFGASVYSPDEAKMAMRIVGLGALQIPVSVAAQHFINAGILQEAAERNIPLFARSIFLQGGLLLGPDALPPHLAALKPVNAALRSIAAEAGVSLPSLLIGAVASLATIYSVVLGVDDRIQLEELLVAASGRVPDAGAAEAAFAASQGLPREVTDPGLWPRLAP